VIKDNYLEEMDRAAKNNKAYYFMSNLIDDAVLELIVQDSMFALLSLGLIFILIRLGTGSWFLAVVGFLEIFFSITVSWSLFKMAFQIEFFPPQNALAFFIVATIGADDIFVFMDAYKGSSDQLDDMEIRMSSVYRKTGMSMLITSATTCIAFLFSIISPTAICQVIWYLHCYCGIL
jgi:Predicted exporters of the RND superfamily